jgi:hypothetical protein
VSDRWQAQAQMALAQVEQLKEMLAEGASWSEDKADKLERSQSGNSLKEECRVERTVTASQAEVQVASSTACDEDSSTPHVCARCTQLQEDSLKHCARVAELEVQTRAMSMEVLRSTQLAGQVGRAALPALYAIESRLIELQGM